MGKLPEICYALHCIKGKRFKRQYECLKSRAETNEHQDKHRENGNWKYIQAIQWFTRNCLYFNSTAPSVILAF